MRPSRLEMPKEAPMLIDMHAHVIPEHFPAAANRASAGRWPSMEHFAPGQARVMIAGQNFRTVHAGNWDVDRRLADMDAAEVNAQAISCLPELMSYWFTPEDGLEMNRYVNDYIAGMCAKAPGRFYGLAAVPLQDPDLAAKELAGIKAAGHLGVQIGSNVLGKSLGDERFLGFFQEAEAQGLAVFVHALHPTFLDRIGDALANAIGFPTDTGLTIASLIDGGTADKVPNLRVAFSHGGGTFPFMLPRYHNGWGGSWDEAPPIRATQGSNPAEVARRFYYDTLVFDARPLRYLIEAIGASQLVIGTDYPYVTQEQPAGRTLRTLNLSPGDAGRHHVAQLLPLPGR
jgi:aminocarboxymuconate-semialdehyde decarboxylase